MKSLKSACLTVMVAASALMSISPSVSAMVQVGQLNQADLAKTLEIESRPASSTLVSYGYYYVPDVPYPFPQSSHERYINSIYY